MLIITERSYKHWPSYDLVYEWEDQILKSISDSKLFFAKEFRIGKHNIIETLNLRAKLNFPRLILGSREAFSFTMSPILFNNIWNISNINTNIIDFYPTKDVLNKFYHNYNKVKNLYVSSREVYDYLIENQPEREVKHLPLTLPDKYRISKDTRFEKKYDLVMVGRQSPTLLGYLRTYNKSHQLFYVYRGEIKDNNFPYYTNDGKFVGYANTRDEYFNLLRQSRVALYSTPGIDDGKNTNGFHQVTPRFLEQIACGCNVISQYIDNSDTDFFELGKMSSRVKDYSDFEKAMDKALIQPADMEMYDKYLKKHYTSTYKTMLLQNH